MNPDLSQPIPVPDSEVQHQLWHYLPPALHRKKTSLIITFEIVLKISFTCLGLLNIAKDTHKKYNMFESIRVSSYHLLNIF
jgi:hypothetical protein